MTPDHSFLDLLLEASFVVQLVLLSLFAASVFSWAIILRKRRMLHEVSVDADRFEDTFWGGGNLEEIYRDLASGTAEPVGMASLFEAGFREFRRLAKQPELPSGQLLDACQRAMQVARMREMDRLERNLSTLATIGSTSPYVGLFGTVWGIMNAFQAIGAVQSASLAMVAPGIAEALVATAIGLVAAIPAVIAYNRYADQVNRLDVRFDAFAEEFIAILQRHAPARRSGMSEAG